MAKNKIILCLIAALAFAGTSFSQITFVGVSADYGTKIKEPGFSVTAFYTVNKQIDITPNLSYYLPHTSTIPNGDSISTWLAGNLDGHYNIFEFGVFEGFGLMGLNFTYVTTEVNEVIQGTPLKYTTYETKTGLNVGFGGAVHFSKFFTPFTEIKYTLGDEIFQIGFRFGILVRLAEDKVREPMDY